MIHRAIIVTAKSKHIYETHQRAAELFSVVSNICTEHYYPLGHKSFFIPPQAGKDQDRWQQARNKFVAYLNTFCDADGKSPIDWVEVQYGDDEIGTMVTRSGDWA